jgi:hypothetical protein
MAIQPRKQPQTNLWDKKWGMLMRAVLLCNNAKNFRGTNPVFMDCDIRDI